MYLNLGRIYSCQPKNIHPVWKLKRNGLQYKRLEYVMGHMSKKGQNHLKAKKGKNGKFR